MTCVKDPKKLLKKGKRRLAEGEAEADLEVGISGANRGHLKGDINGAFG